MISRPHDRRIAFGQEEARNNDSLFYFTTPQKEIKRLFSKGYFHCFYDS